MSAGLPIATKQSSQAGLLMQGSIQRCWGNWIGTEMSIGMMFVAADITPPPESASNATGPTDSNFIGPVQSSTNLTLWTNNRQGKFFSRTGYRSLDRRSLPRGVSPTVALPGLGGAGSIPAKIGGAILGNLPVMNFGAASSTFAGVTTALVGGGGGGFSLVRPLNLIHNLSPQMPLAAAIYQTLTKALPNLKVNVKISPQLMLAYQDAGMYQNLEQYSGYIQKLSNSILGTKGYLGVHMSSYGNGLNVWDGTVAETPGQIDPIDLIGQPTWIALNKISMKTVLRADLHVSDVFTLPPGILINMSPDAVIPGTPEQKVSLSFSGAFQILKVLHIGDFRNPDGSSWSSNFEAIVFGSGGDDADKPSNPDEQ
jgi:hypothetical protein